MTITVRLPRHPPPPSAMILCRLVVGRQREKFLFGQQSTTDDDDDNDSTIAIVSTSFRILYLEVTTLLYVSRQGVLHQRRFVDHRRSLEARKVYFCLVGATSWSVYLQDFLKVKC
jgi:hypothetical protein